jgi:predicted nuclease of predicted toxin-antitoxin system
MLSNYMKLLLDENLPKRLKEDFANHEIYSIRVKDGMV